MRTENWRTRRKPRRSAEVAGRAERRADALAVGYGCLALEVQQRVVRAGRR